LHMQADVPQEQGTVIFFPAYMLHKVEPVLQGMRHSLVMWAYGPSFS
jgi:PKHD-type hydroxylase